MPHCILFVFSSDESFNLSLHCVAEDLAAQLGTIFITQLTVSNAIELGSLSIARLAKSVAVSYFTDDEKDWIWHNIHQKYIFEHLIMQHYL